MMRSLIQRESEPSELTPREKEILLLVAQGHSNKTIAGMLWLSQKTVRNHMTHILRKLGLERRAQLVCYVWRMGWMSTAEEPKEE
ncbi:MAG: response regulator transcription factor [Chloroflexi bacterium]|nr:response regulator transcription factor [Chloroflexota bacterium]